MPPPPIPSLVPITVLNWILFRNFIFLLPQQRPRTSTACPYFFTHRLSYFFLTDELDFVGPWTFLGTNISIIARGSAHGQFFLSVHRIIDVTRLWRRLIHFRRNSSRKHLRPPKIRRDTRPSSICLMEQQEYWSPSHRTRSETWSLLFHRLNGRGRFA